LLNKTIIWCCEVPPLQNKKLTKERDGREVVPFFRVFSLGYVTRKRGNREKAK